MTPTRIFVVGFPGEVAKQTTLELAGSPDTRVFLLVSQEYQSQIAELNDEADGHVEIVEGDPSRIDFGLRGSEYNALAAEITAIAYLPLPGPLRSIGPKPDSRPWIREIIELGLAASHLRHTVVLSHLDIAGTTTGHFAERDFDVGQKFVDPSCEDRFRAERIVRRFASALPVTVVRSGWIAGDGEQLCPLVPLMLAADEQLFQSGKGAPERLLFVDRDSLVRILVELIRLPALEETNTLHVAFGQTDSLTELVAKVREMAAQSAPLGFDLSAGARRVLRRADSHRSWSAKEFFKKQAFGARISTALTEKILAKRGLPLPVLSDELLDRLVVQAMERIIGFK